MAGIRKKTGVADCTRVFNAVHMWDLGDKPLLRYMVKTINFVWDLNVCIRDE